MPTFTMIALDTNAVIDEIDERSAYDLDFAKAYQKLTPEQINQALAIVNPSDAFYEMFDELRMRVIECAAELAKKDL